MEIIISPLLRFLILIVDFEKETVALANSSKNLLLGSLLFYSLLLNTLSIFILPKKFLLGGLVTPPTPLLCHLCGLQKK